MGRFLRRLAHEQRAVGAIELALVAPVIVLLLLGATDVAMGYSAKLKLQQAAARATEMATARTPNSLTKEKLKTEAAAAAAAVSPGASSEVDLWLECNGGPRLAFTGGCSTGQEIARYASVVISGRYQPIFGFPFFSKTGVAISARSSVRVQ